MSQKRISILTSGHSPFDERIFWKFGNSLTENGFSVSILFSLEKMDKQVNELSIIGFDGNSLSSKNKITKFLFYLNILKPDLIICEEMIPVFAAIKYKRQNKTVKIILDITEWYPENVAFKFRGIKRWVKYFSMLLPYIYILNKSNYLIIGEKRKQRRYKLLSPFISKIIIGYYPVLKYFNYCQPDLSSDEIILGYAGVITYERGIVNLLKVSVSVANKYPLKKITLLLFGRFTYLQEEKDFKTKLNDIPDNLKIEFVDWTEYNKMSPVIERMDLCFDLRKRNFIYKNSLPIKIFEYMACGKPFIYSEVNPIKKELDYSDYGKLVDPENDEQIIEAISFYINNPVTARIHSVNSRKIIEKNKNWETESKKLIGLVNKLLS